VRTARWPEPRRRVSPRDRARACFSLLLVGCVLVMALVGCGPSQGRRHDLTTGMCPQCGSADLAVEHRTERSTYDGAEAEVLSITCRGCGHSWEAPGLVKQ
jgi:RNase P subunit RPR2